MKKHFLLSLLFSIQLGTFGQELSINILPRYSFGATIPSNYQLVQGQSFITTGIKTTFKGSLFKPDGTTTDFDQTTNGLGLDFLFSRSNQQNNNAWGILLGLYQHKFLQYSEFPEFAWKNTTLQGSYNFYRTTGLNFGIRRTIFNYKTIGWYAQLAGMYSFQLQDLNSKGNEWLTTVAESNSYVEAGTGTTGSTTKVNANNMTITPEIGLITKGNIGLEISLSYQIPMGSPLALSKSSYFKANKIFGIEKADLTQQSLWLNLRLPIRIFTRYKQTRTFTTSNPPVVIQSPTPTIPSKRLQDVCLTVIDARTKRTLPNARVSIDGQLFFSNSQGVATIYDVPVGKKGVFSVQLLDYIRGEVLFEIFPQDGCQLLSVELTPIEKAKTETVEIDGKVVKKGESVVLNAIQFEQGRSELLFYGKAELDKVVAWMKRYPNLNIELSGHTSNEGDQEENRKLSEDRVIACKAYLTNKLKGSNERIKTIGYGSTRPRVPNNSEENRKKNRRVELKIDSL